MSYYLYYLHPFFLFHSHQLRAKRATRNCVSKGIYMYIQNLRRRTSSLSECLNVLIIMYGMGHHHHYEDSTYLACKYRIVQWCGVFFIYLYYLFFILFFFLLITCVCPELCTLQCVFENPCIFIHSTLVF